MISDIRVNLGITDHPKRRRLTNLLGHECVGYLFDLWVNAAMRRPDGLLTYWDEKDIAIAARWKGDENEFVKALLDTCWLEKGEEGVYKLHDWEEHEPWAVHSKRRSEVSRSNARKRWERRYNSDNDDDFQCEKDKKRNANSNANSISVSNAIEGEERKGEERKSKEEEGVGEGDYTIAEGLRRLKEFDFGACYLINDRDYLALLKSPMPEKETIEFKVALAWVGYRRFYRYGTGLKASFNYLVKLLQDGMSVERIWKICEKAHSADGSKTALPVWEVATAPMAVKEQADKSREIIKARQRERDSEERLIRRGGNNSKIPDNLKALLNGIGTKIELTESEKEMTWKGG